MHVSALFVKLLVANTVTTPNAPLIAVAGADGFHVDLFQKLITDALQHGTILRIADGSEGMATANSSIVADAMTHFLK